MRSDEPLKGHRDDPAFTSDQPVTSVKEVMHVPLNDFEVEGEVIR